MEEYGYTQNEMGEWVPLPGAQTSGPGPVPSHKQTSSAPEDKGLSGEQARDIKPQPDDKSSLLARAESKDGFSLFSDSKPEASAVPGLPPRPPDFDDFWYQAEDGNWYNEYEDMGLVFADPEESSKSSSLTNNKVVPNKIDSNSSQKQTPKPKDYDEHWYQDEFGVLRNSYDKKDEEDDFYTDEELAKIEAKLKQENQSKSDTVNTAVEPKQSVIETPKICNSSVAIKDSKKETEQRKLPKPADFDDHWYQDHAGNWLNRYNKDGLEYENNGPPTSILSGQRDTPLKKTKQKVSFESDKSFKGRSTKSGKNPRERWLWAYGRIVQVGAFVQTLYFKMCLVPLCHATVLVFKKVYTKVLLTNGTGFT